MRYGFAIAGVPVERIGGFAKEAEDAGFEVVVTNDNRGDHDVFVKMAAMAVATNTIQIGSGICRAFVRTPIATGPAIPAGAVWTCAALAAPLSIVNAPWRR